MKKLRGREAVGHISGVSPLNFDQEVRAGMSLPKRVVINDLTLREGRQLEGVVLTVDECVRIARQLEELGVPMIQIANFSAYDYEIMKALGKLNLRMKTECMTSRQRPPFTREMLRELVDRSIECHLGVKVNLPLSNDILRALSEARGEGNKSLDRLKKEEIEFAVEMVEYVKKQGSTMNVNMQDFLRCDWEYMQEIISELVKAGVGVITVDDIAGPALPAAYTYRVRKLKSAVPKAILGTHVHNDFGLGLPALLAAFEGGAEVLDCGINSLGERAGHADLASVVICLEFLYGYDTGIKTEKLYETAVLVADITKQPIPKTNPVVGQNVFSHVMDWHWQFPKYPWLLSALAPEVVGNASRAIIGEFCGPYGIRMKGKELGIDIPPEKIDTVRARLREEMRWRKRPLTDDEFRKIALA